jgi:hypothetical protein
MVSTKNNIVEVEVSAPNGRKLFFRPIGRPVRGRINFNDARTPAEFQRAQRWPEPVPGVVLGINLDTGEKYMRDPIHDDQYTSVRQRILRYGFQLPPANETFDSESLATWVYWLQRAVEGGCARVIKGELPPVESLEGEPRKSFISNPRRNPNSGMTDALKAMTNALENQTKVFEALLKKLV